jgi:hypothetical protein
LTSSHGRWGISIKEFENGKETEDEEMRALVEEALKQVARVEDQGGRVKCGEKYAQNTAYQ